MKKIAIIGHGYVGQSVERFFCDHFDVEVYDPKYKTEVENPDSEYDFADEELKRASINTADMAVICVPTPEAEDHSVDLSIIQEVLSWVETPLILIESTIPPGTTDSLKEQFGKRIVFSPEYIGEGNYEVPWWKDKGYPHPTDMRKHDFQIFGGDRQDCIEVSHFFQRVVGPEPTMRFTEARAAELTKYMENSFFAVKVIFCNEFYDIAKKFGVNFEEVRELWLLDGRVGRMHTAVFPDNRGFGGKCLPKDVNGIVEQSKKAGYVPDLLVSVLATNEKIKTNQS